MSKRKSFIVHKDSLDILEDLTDEQAGQLLKAIWRYQRGEEVKLAPLVKVAFNPFKHQFIRDDEKYETTCKRRAEAGSRGGKQKVANASKSKQTVAKVADNKNKNKSKSDIKENTIKEKAPATTRPRFVKPTVDEVRTYCIERNNGIDPQAFIDHYEANGWVQGKGKPIKSWQACVRTWENNRKDQQQIQDPIMALASQGPMYGDSI